MKRYAAKLLFQFRVDCDGDPGKRRLCEERIINFRARSAREALRVAKRHGRRDRHSYRNPEGNRVTFEFVGVMDLMSLGAEAGREEVWYEIRERVRPMERRGGILPGDGELLARVSEDER